MTDRATDLAGRTAVVVGGSGGVGEGVVARLLQRGAHVVATGRSASSLAALTDRLAAQGDAHRLDTAVIDSVSPELGDTVADLRDRHGAFDLAVISVAAWGEQGPVPLLELTDAAWDDLVSANLTSVFRFYRAIWPVLAPRGVLVQLNGMSAEIPMPGASGRALTAAAVKSMTRTLAEETRGSGRRVYEVILGVARTRARRQAGVDDDSWLTGEEIGEHVGELLLQTSSLSDTVVQYLVDRSGPRSAIPTRRA